MTRWTSFTEEPTQPVPLDVAAAEYRDGRAARYEFFLEQRRDRDRTTRLDDELQSVQEKTHRLVKRIVVHQHDIVEILLVVREGDVSDLDGEKTVSETARRRNAHRLSRRPSFGELG